MLFIIYLFIVHSKFLSISDWAKISQIILHDQLPLTSLGRHNANISTVSDIVLIIKEKGQQEHSSSPALVEIQS